MEASGLAGPVLWGYDMVQAVAVAYVRNEYHGDTLFHIVERTNEDDDLPTTTLCGIRTVFFPHHEWPRRWEYHWPPAILCPRCDEVQKQRLGEQFEANIDRLLSSALDPSCVCMHRKSEHMGPCDTPDCYLTGACAVAGCGCNDFREQEGDD